MRHGPALLTCGLLVALSTAAEETIRFPTTYDQVWLREGSKRFGGGSMTGQLIVTPGALEFSTRKRERIIDFSEIQTVSLGGMRGDVDTQWVVLAVGPPGTTQLIGLRDGRKMGYGQRTEEIHRVIREALRRAGAGQYAVQDGFRTYDEIDDQFTVAVPVGWQRHHRRVVGRGGRMLWGHTLFSAELPESRADDDTVEALLDRVDRGEATVFYIDRREAAKGMRCSGFSASADRRLLRWLEQEALLVGEGEWLAGPESEPLAVGECVGRRLLLRKRHEHGTEVHLDLRVVASGETVFLMGLLAAAGDVESARLFDVVAGSLQPAVGR